MVWVAELRAPKSTSCWKLSDGAQTESTGFGDSSTMLGFGWRVLRQSCWRAIVSFFLTLGFIHHASNFLVVSLLVSYLVFMGTQCFYFLTWNNNKDGYSTLATLCSRAGYPLFKIRPKLHMMCHLGHLDYHCLGLGRVSIKCKNKWLVFGFFMRKVHPARLDLKHALLQYPDAQWFLSISTYMTWSDEDFIGRISRISRRTSPLTAADRTITRSLALYRRQWIATFGRAYAHV